MVWLRNTCFAPAVGAAVAQEVARVVEVSLGKITEAQTAPDVQVGTLLGNHHHYCKSLWTKATDKCIKM